MKIVIVGAGIGGLSTFLFLKKLINESHPHGGALDISIYEKYGANLHDGKKPTDSRQTGGAAAAPALPAATVGGVLGVSPNGMHVLRDLDEDLYDDIVSAGNAVRTYSMRNALGWELAKFPATDAGHPPMPTVVVRRHELWKAFRTRVPDASIIQADVTRVISEQGRKPRVLLSGGLADVEADLVIGADGVRSVVRRIVADDPDGVKYPATYEGLSSVAGWIPASDLGPSHRKDEMVMTLGPDSFFGYGIHASKPDGTSRQREETDQGTSEDQAGWWSTYPLDWDPVNDAKPDPEQLHRDLQSRHAKWHDSAIRQAVTDAHVDHVYPTWTVGELPTWILNGNVVLMGDAAHALQTSSGQGVSQVLEDAQALTMLIERYTRQGMEGLEEALKKYVDIRKPRIDRIVARSKMMGNTKRRKNLLQEWITYFFIWLMGKWGPDAYTQWLFGELPLDELQEICKNTQV